MNFVLNKVDFLCRYLCHITVLSRALKNKVVRGQNSCSAPLSGRGSFTAKLELEHETILIGKQARVEFYTLLTFKSAEHTLIDICTLTYCVAVHFHQHVVLWDIYVGHGYYILLVYILPTKLVKDLTVLAF